MSGLNKGINGTKYNVPLYFLEEYPKFIEFLDVFYDWLYRQQGFTAEEIQLYLDNPSSWVDQYSNESPLEQLIDVKATKTVGSATVDYLADHFLVRSFENLLSMDFTLEDVEGRPLFAENDKDDNINAWYDDFGFQRTADKSFPDFGEFVPKDSDGLLTSDGDTFSVFVDDTKRRTLDHPRWLKLLKHIYSIRGTRKAIELFFWIYFGAPVTIHQPKTEIGGLDDNFDLDGVVGLRDDYYYDEFSYVIMVPGDITEIQGVFDKVFRQHFHPGGFTVFLESSRGK
uniref:Baseplate wedge protein n=1 Tax=Serratia phage Kevin TaxID=3161161 RepID=A0AAU8KXS7_9CAUD